MLFKIVRAYKKGILKEIIIGKVRKIFPLYFIQDPTLASKCREHKCYRRLKAKYASLIQEGVGPLPMEHSNTIWICWFQGFENAPDLVKACVQSVRNHCPDKEIVLLTEENINQFVTFPDYISKKWENGRIGAAHYSDLLRTELLCKYGGIWMDATLLVTASLPDYISNAPLFVFKSMDLGRSPEQPIVASSWFIAAHSNHPILRLTRKLLHQYWKEHNGLKHYFLFHMFFAMAARRYSEHWAQVPVFNNHSPHVLQFELDQPYTEVRWEQIASMSSLHKLNHHIDFSGTYNSFYHHILQLFL